jgi:hypothetical protein
VEFIFDIVTLRCHCCDIVLNVHAPTECKSVDTKDGLFMELEHVFDQIPKYHMKILLRFQCQSSKRRYFQTSNQE